MKLHFLVRAWLHVWHPGYRNLPPTEGCKGRHESLFWMRMMLDIYKAVHQCEICALTKFLMAPLIEISVMFYWWSLSSNLCKWKRRKKNIFQDALPWNNSEQSRWHFHLVFLQLTLILFPCPLPFCLYVVYLVSQAAGWGMHRGCAPCLCCSGLWYHGNLLWQTEQPWHCSQCGRRLLPNWRGLNLLGWCCFSTSGL